MKHDLIGRHYERMIQEHYLIPVSCDGTGIHYRVSRKYGEGTARRLMLGEGLDINYWHGFSASCLELNNVCLQPDMLEISCCLEGSMQVGLYEPNEQYELAAGQMMFYYHKNFLPSYRLSAWEYTGFSVHVHHDYLAGWLAPGCVGQLDDEWRCNIGLLMRQQRLLVRNAPLALLRLAGEIQSGPPVSHVAAFLAFQAKVMDFVSGSLQAREEKVDDGALPPRDLDLVNRARQYLQEHLYQPPSIAELARILHTNSGTLKRNFKRAYQTTIYGYVKQQRLEKSLNLLKHTDLSIADIASEVGYANPSKYATAFKLHTGMTPSEYKKNRG
ncbi:helix-turn-helix domain-containing protein [Acetonema longum]|uniref:AraC family transcriptional regulator n=1 Tax=Acetonema longum DSM 6540 TaxID=1009370 RepID=F7NME2_9FIRM|nr:AraC family transcriptional regulator [Acetonema longum]EGO62787.1 AraC family transcriptional regulator [Acetonema longum DSM 6540]